jgi:hypothetical protein
LADNVLPTLPPAAAASWVITAKREREKKSEPVHIAYELMVELALCNVQMRRRRLLFCATVAQNYTSS